jgi:hypothetical protein
LLPYFFYPLAGQPNAGQGRLILEVSRSHTTVDWTPLYEGSARSRDLYLTTKNTQKRETSMLPDGFELAIAASHQPQTLALDSSTTGVSINVITLFYIAFYSLDVDVL